jgi:hypothetical protein
VFYSQLCLILLLCIEGRHNNKTEEHHSWTRAVEKKNVSIIFDAVKPPTPTILLSPKLYNSLRKAKETIRLDPSPLLRLDSLLHLPDHRLESNTLVTVRHQP